MFKKLLITLFVLFSSSLLWGVDAGAKVYEDDFLIGVQKLSDEQMQSVTGEDTIVTVAWPVTGRETEVHVTPNEGEDLWVYINADTSVVFTSDHEIPGWNG